MAEDLNTHKLERLAEDGRAPAGSPQALPERVQFTNGLFRPLIGRANKPRLTHQLLGSEF